MGLRGRTLSTWGLAGVGTSPEDWLGAAADSDAPHYWPKSQRREH